MTGSTTARKLRPAAKDGFKAPSTPRGKKTVLALKDAARSCMRSKGYHETTVAEICDEAQVSVGTFYVYFVDKESLCTHVMRDDLNANTDFIYSGHHTGDPYQSILSANRRLVETYAQAGEGGCRALAQMIDAIPAVRAVWSETNAKTARYIVSHTHGLSEAALQNRKESELLAHLLQLNADNLLLSYFAWQDPNVRALIDDPEDLPELLSVMWFQSLYGSLPTRVSNSAAKRLCAVLETLKQTID
jgi:TetR/AcrR family transcriptional regulator, ethionamide resistance regulator